MLPFVTLANFVGIVQRAQLQVAFPCRSLKVFQDQGTKKFQQMFEMDLIFHPPFVSQPSRHWSWWRGF